MKPIVTLTLNPAIDVACEADEVRHTQKTRTYSEHIEPGGGGINVARALCGFSAPGKGDLPGGRGFRAKFSTGWLRSAASSVIQYG